MTQNVPRFMLLCWMLILFCGASFSFKTEQQKYQRVRTAYLEKEKYLREKLNTKGIKLSAPIELYLRAFKEEALLELWAKKTAQSSFQRIDAFDICSMSGTVGPKRKQGDRQVPEGFYHIDRFNPQSNFYLSLGINYPNASDKILGVKNMLGGDIFIHGSCVSIGCMAMTDDKIKELYVYAVEAFNGGQQKIPVSIFPARLTPENLKRLKTGNVEHGLLWEELEQAYRFFNQHKTLPSVSFLDNGRHRIN